MLLKKHASPTTLQANKYLKLFKPKTTLEANYEYSLALKAFNKVKTDFTQIME